MEESIRILGSVVSLSVMRLMMGRLLVMPIGSAGATVSLLRLIGEGFPGVFFRCNRCRCNRFIAAGRREAHVHFELRFLLLRVVVLGSRLLQRHVVY